MKHISAVTLAFLFSIYLFMQFSYGLTGYEKPNIDPEKLKDGEKHIEKGVYHFNKGAYRQALIEFENAVEISPQFFNARYNMARVHVVMGKTKEAIGELELISSFFEGNVAAYNTLGQIYVDKGEKEKARELFEKAVKNGRAILKDTELAQAKIDTAMALHNLGSMQSTGGNLDAAEKNLRQSIELDDSNYYSHYALGALLVKKMEYKEAKDELLAARELNTEFVQTDIELAKAYLLSSPPNAMRAISTLREAVRKDPENAEIYELLGNCYVIRGKTDEKARENDYTEAMKHYRNALNLDKDNQRYRILLAKACTLAGEHDTAQKVLEKLGNKEELSDDLKRQVLMVEAHVLRSREQWAEAAGKYKTVYKMDPMDYAVCLEAGKCFFRAGNFKEAEHYLETALKPFEESAPDSFKEKLDEARKMLLEIRGSE